MMNEPSIEKLTADGLNRYQICIATSKVAREIINEWADEDKGAMGDDKAVVKKTVHDDKPVKTAVHAIDSGDWEILPEGASSNEAVEEDIFLNDPDNEDAPLQE